MLAIPGKRPLPRLPRLLRTLAGRRLVSTRWSALDILDVESCYSALKPALTQHVVLDVTHHIDLREPGGFVYDDEPKGIAVAKIGSAPEHSNAQGMALLAVVGIAVNGFAVLRLRGDKGFNARVVAWHLLEDVLGWLAVLAVSIVLFFTDIYILDPLLSLLIALYILYNVACNLQKTLALFLHAVPEDMDPERISQNIQALPGVDSTHHLHAWSLEGESHVLSMHVVVDKSAQQTEVIDLRKKIRQLLKGEDLEHVTIEIEYGPNDCMVA